MSGIPALTRARVVKCAVYSVAVGLGVVTGLAAVAHGFVKSRFDRNLCGPRLTHTSPASVTYPRGWDLSSPWVCPRPRPGRDV